MLLRKIGPNFHRVTLGNLNIWFSYETPVAFQYGCNQIVMRENVWGPTTGKHLNSLSREKVGRLSAEDFNRQLEAAVSPKAATT